MKLLYSVFLGPLDRDSVSINPGFVFRLGSR